MTAASPRRPLTREEVRAVDRRAIDLLGIPGVVLMENAGLGLTDVVCEHALGLGPAAAQGSLGPIGVVCGRGNNGGDGFVVARHLTLRGVRVRVAYTGSFAERDEGDAATMRRICEKMQLPIDEAPDGAALARVLAGWSDVTLLVDALFGNGLAAPLREPGLGLVRALDQDPRPKVACDVPSGLDCDTGLPLGHAVRCARTATFVAEKVGFAKARAFTGPVTVVPIGCPVDPSPR
jgi:NAD(P)H-hydrate epimerase